MCACVSEDVVCGFSILYWRFSPVSSATLAWLSLLSWQIQQPQNNKLDRISWKVSERNACFTGIKQKWIFIIHHILKENKVKVKSEFCDWELNIYYAKHQNLSASKGHESPKGDRNNKKNVKNEVKKANYKQHLANEASTFTLWLQNSLPFDPHFKGPTTETHKKTHLIKSLWCCWHWKYIAFIYGKQAHSPLTIIQECIAILFCPLVSLNALFNKVHSSEMNWIKK